MSAPTEPRTLVLHPWPDPPGRGVTAHSAYVDRYWMPLLGPDATCVARVLAHAVRERPEAVRLPVPHVAAELGLDGDGAWSRVGPALDRLADAGVVSIRADGVVVVRSELPYLTDDQLARLPEQLQAAHLTSAAPGPDATTDAPAPAARPSARLGSLAATVEELRTNDELGPRQLAYRFQHLVRLAEEARDEALLDWAAPDLVVTLAECQLTAQAVSEAIWATQHAVASSGQLPESSRAALSDAAAGLVDWLITEFPPDSDAWVLDNHDL